MFEWVNKCKPLENSILDWASMNMHISFFKDWGTIDCVTASDPKQWFYVDCVTAGKSYTPGSASAPTGLTAGSLQASTMKRNLCSDTTTKKYLVAEYCEAAGLSNQKVTTHLLDAVVRHMHKILLCDLTPPLGGPPIPPRLCQGKA